MDNKVTMTPVGIVFMIIAFSPYLFLKLGDAFGSVFLFLLPFFILVILYSLYIHYKRKTIKNNSSFFHEIEKDLPDMSPIHIFFFFLITTPLWFFVAAADMMLIWGVIALYIFYTIYYYGFKKKK